MVSEEKRMVVLEGRSFLYTLIRKNVKNINLRVKPDGQIIVSAGKRVPAEYVDSVIREKQQFLSRALGKFEERKEIENKKIRRYVTGEEFWLLGRQVRLQVGQADRERASLQEDVLFLYVKDTSDFRRKERLYLGWRQQFCREVFQQVLEKVYLKFQKYQVPCPRVRVRSMTSRWGSCQPEQGKITLNSRLIGAPLEDIEYVAVHEFAHFIHPNHSKAFWNLVAEFVPDWKLRRKELNENPNL